MSKSGEMQANNFLPANYKLPDKSKQFLKIEPGDNVIRFLSNPLIGWVLFNEENKPVRRMYELASPTLGDFSKEEMAELKAKKDSQTGGFEGSKHFWIGLVWDRKTNSPKILEITQTTIIKPLFAYSQDEDWGDLRNFDINIHREGTGKNDTQFTITPKPHKPIDDKIVAVVHELEDNNLLDLEAIWRGEYPFEKYLY